MKVEIDVLDDQLEILKRLQSLSSVIKNHIGEIPVSLANIIGDSYLSQIDHAIANLEYRCRRWIIETSLMHQKIDGITVFENMVVHAKDTSIIDDEYY